jgi:glyoxylase-like metal-dependent hydrolase (beta-lactamase superfamily II)
MSDQSLAAHTTVITGDSNGKYPDGNSVLIEGTLGRVLLDPSLTVHGRSDLHGTIDRVLVSHAHEDHMAGLAAVGAQHICAHHDDLIGVRSLDGILEVYGMPEAAGEAWREVLVRDFHLTDQPTATGFGDGDVFDLGGVSIRVMHLPGHTRGHSAFVVEPDGVAFVGDVDLSSFGPYYGDHWSDLSSFIRSIAQVRDLEAAAYVTFHHKGVVFGQDEFRRQLDQFASVIDRRTESLLGLLAQPRSMDELVDVGIVYRAGTRPDHFGDTVERRTIAMHLGQLIEHGQARRHADATFERV